MGKKSCRQSARVVGGNLAGEVRAGGNTPTPTPAASPSLIFPVNSRSLPVFPSLPLCLLYFRSDFSSFNSLTFPLSPTFSSPSYTHRYHSLLLPRFFLLWGDFLGRLVLVSLPSLGTQPSPPLLFLLSGSPPLVRIWLWHSRSSSYSVVATSFLLLPSLFPPPSPSPSAGDAFLRCGFGSRLETRNSHYSPHRRNRGNAEAAADRFETKAIGTQKAPRQSLSAVATSAPPVRRISIALAKRTSRKSETGCFCFCFVATAQCCVKLTREKPAGTSRFRL